MEFIKMFFGGSHGRFLMRKYHWTVPSEGPHENSQMEIMKMLFGRLPWEVTRCVSLGFSPIARNLPKKAFESARRL